MRRIVFTLLTGILVFSTPATFSQETYKVIKVNGQIIYVRTGNSMLQGDEFPETENLSFQSPNSRAAVINPNLGRFILTPDNYENLASAKSNFLPAMSNISTRGGAINSLSDLQNQFCDYLAIICEASYQINPYHFPMDEEQFFFLKFKHNGEEINKKLKSENNKLILSREEILEVDDKPIENTDSPEMSLYYYSKGETEYISDFGLIFPDPDQLEGEIQIILDASVNNSYSEKVNDISGYLYEFYGKPDKQDIIYYLEKTFGLKRE